MATSQRELILADMAERLDEIAGITVERSRLAPLRDSQILVVVTPLDEQATPGFQSTYLRRLRVLVSVRTLSRGVLDQVLDATGCAITAKLMGSNAARTLGGLLSEPLLELGRVWQMDDAEGIDLQLTYELPYETTMADESVAA